MSGPAEVAIVVATPRDLRRMVGTSEREVAGPAEDLLRSLGPGLLGSRIWVLTRDPGMRRRLIRYLRDVKRDVLAEIRRGTP
ncbi:hypothetical protein [Methylobacterium organophilum]|uniref:hypothetical protein n=1 Tax=Methylobacterium organophilum TaxID=410 RepID=UPI001EE178B3|nr:hypothetical protein [Methylobacterium organophilum]